VYVAGFFEAPPPGNWRIGAGVDWRAGHPAQLERPGPMDAITLLRDDHKTLRDLTSKLADTTERAVETRKTLLARIEAILTAHTTIEEELFYPAFIEAADDIESRRMVAEAVEEHRAADRKVIPDLHKLDPASVQWSGDAKVLKDYIFHHLKEEEEEMFPKVRALIDRRAMRALGDRMAVRREEMLAEVKA
jgi:hemerythrin superfamily protein